MEATFIAGDWETSNLRLFLCDAHGTALESTVGPKAAETREDFAQVFTSLTAPGSEYFLSGLLASQRIDGAAAAVAGLAHLHQHLSQQATA